MKKNKWIFLFGMIILWEAVSYFIGNPQIMPSGLTIFSKFIHEMLYEKLWLYSLYSLFAIVIGLMISVILSLIISMISIRIEWVKDMFGFLNTILHPLPGIAILPLLIIWLGVGYSAILALVVHSVMWPILTNLFSALDSFPKTLSMVADNYELNLFKKFFYIYLPGIMPSFISGLKTGWARAFRAVISAEMFFGAIGSTGGLGWYIVKKRVFFDTPGIFSGLIVIIVIGILLDSFVFKQLEMVTLEKWGGKS